MYLVEFLNVLDTCFWLTGLNCFSSPSHIILHWWSVAWSIINLYKLSLTILHSSIIQTALYCKYIAFFCIKFNSLRSNSSISTCGDKLNSLWTVIASESTTEAITFFDLFVGVITKNGILLSFNIFTIKAHIWVFPVPALPDMHKCLVSELILISLLI